VKITFTFNVVWGDVNCTVVIFSNSTVSQFVFDHLSAQISFTVSGGTGTVGYCNVTIPKALLGGGPWIIKIDDAPAPGLIQADNATHSFLYFTYTHSAHQVTIQGTWMVPEFPSTMILPLLMVLTAIIFMLGRGKLRKSGL
jgi:hypothetical protein